MVLGQYHALIYSSDQARMLIYGIYNVTIIVPIASGSVSPYHRPFQHQRVSDMAFALLRHKVSDFTAWKTVFDSIADVRAKAGEKSAQVIQVDGDPNDVMIVFSYDSLDAAKAFLGSNDVKQAMSNAGVQGAPDIVFGTGA